jgi:hypothetical protein
MENELKMLMAQAKIELARMEAQSPAKVGEAWIYFNNSITLE